ncbi:MAG: phage tail tape measure protein [Psychrobacillus sp.]
MSKTFETTVEIKGAIGSTFTEAFRKANHGLVDLKGEARAVQRELDRLGQDFRQGKIHQSQYTEETQKLGSELKTLEREMKDATSAQKRFAQETAAAKKQMEEQALAAKARNKALMTDLQAGVGNAVGRAKTAATIVGVGTAAAATATAVQSINVAADFEAQLSKVAAKAEASKEEMLALRQTALELGASTSLSAPETALAMDELAAGGMNVNSIIAAMPGIIAGAEASGEDLSLVSSTVSSALSIWGLKAEKASHVSDILAEAANRSAASVDDMRYAFKYAGAPAASLGKSLEETAAAVALITDKGIDGSTAGTALRSGLLALNNPVKAQQKVMDKYGMVMHDSNDELLSMSDIIRELQKSLKGMSESEQTAILAKLVGTEAVSAFLSLVKTGPDALDDMTKALENSGGAAAKASKIMLDNYAGAKEEMMGAFETGQIAFATPILPVMKDVMNGVGNIISDNMDNIEEMGGKVAGVIQKITAPIAMTEPVRPSIEPHMDPDYVEQAMSKYATDLEKYELFKKMSGSDKVNYMLDEAVDTIEKWIGGSGGEAMESLFTEVGTIAGKAWISAFKTSAKGAVGELADGNVAGALAMGAAANAMTGGLLLSGGLAGGKWALGKGKEMLSNRKGKGTAASSPPPSPKSDTTSNSSTAKRFKGKNAAAKPPKISQSSIGTMGNVAKVAGKATVPLAVTGSLIGVATSNNKAEATGSAIGGIVGGLSVAKLGAAVGTIIAPGIGTAIGGAIGGLAGSLGASWLGGKAGGALSSNASGNAAVAQKPSPISDATTQNTTAINQSLVTLNTNVTALSSYFGTATTDTKATFSELQSKTAMLNNNIHLLTSYVGQASGWIASLSGIQPAAQRVITALATLEQRINAIDLPNSASSRRVAYE